MNPVLTAKFQRIYPKLFSYLVYVTFQSKEALGNAVTTKRSGRWQIGIDNLGQETNIGTGIHGQCFRAGIALYSERMCTIGACIGKQFHRVSNYGAIAHDSCLHTNDLWMARTAAAKLFGTRKF